MSLTACKYLVAVAIRWPNGKRVGEEYVDQWAYSISDACTQAAVEVCARNSVSELGHEVAIVYVGPALPPLTDAAVDAVAKYWLAKRLVTVEAVQ